MKSENIMGNTTAAIYNSLRWHPGLVSKINFDLGCTFYKKGYCKRGNRANTGTGNQDNRESATDQPEHGRY